MVCYILKLLITFLQFYYISILINIYFSYMFTSSFKEGIEPIILSSSEVKPFEGPFSMVWYYF